MPDVTQILNAIEAGDPSAAEELLPLIYNELRKRAAARMAQESPDHTLQATALVHEAYLRLVDVEQAQHWNSLGHFYGAAAEAMRRILVENARYKMREKHGGSHRRVELDRLDIKSHAAAQEFLDLDESLLLLTREEPMAGKVVKLRFFAGLTIDETATTLEISVRTANRHWAYARAWLFQRLNPDHEAGN